MGTGDRLSQRPNGSPAGRLLQAAPASAGGIDLLAQGEVAGDVLEQEGGRVVDGETGIGPEVEHGRSRAGSLPGLNGPADAVAPQEAATLWRRSRGGAGPKPARRGRM